VYVTHALRSLQMFTLLLLLSNSATGLIQPGSPLNCLSRHRSNVGHKYGGLNAGSQSATLNYDHKSNHWFLPQENNLGALGRFFKSTREFRAASKKTEDNNSTKIALDTDWSKIRGLASADLGLLSTATVALVAAAMCDVAIPSFSGAALSAGK
jgi:hypothetical protein